MAALTYNQQEMIRAITEFDFKAARRWALCSLEEDKTQKNEKFVEKYTKLLQEKSQSKFIELPYNLKDSLICEDVSQSFKKSRYYLAPQEKELSDSILRIAKAAQRLAEMDIPYRNATLLFGKPGTGKTMFGRYIAFKKDFPFCYINISNIVDSHMGATASAISRAFSYVAENPCVFLIDEIDVLGGARFHDQSSAGHEKSNIVTSLMQELDRLPNNVIILGATNRVDLLDEALLSRFPVKHEMKPFTEEETKLMIEHYLTDVPIEIEESIVDQIAKRSVNQRNAINQVIQEIARKIEQKEER